MSESAGRAEQGAQAPAALRAVLDDLDLFPDRADRIQMLISIAERFRPVPESIAQRPYGCEHRVPACESDAYVWVIPQGDGTLKLHFAVENPQGISAKCLAVILEEGLSGQPLAQVAAVGPDIVYRIFGNELSMGKSMGLTALVSMVQNAARRAAASAGDEAALTG